MKKNTLLLAMGATIVAFASCSKDDNPLPPDSRPVLDSVINGGGAKYPNKVFIDLSEGRQTSVNRANWDLGFSNGSEFRVTLNASVNMLAKAVSKNDMNAVGAADTTGFAELMVIGNTATPASLSYIDNPNGDITQTAMAEVSATATENKVYIINRGPDPDGNARKWQKIRVLRNNNGGYTLQYADIAATNFSEVQVAKNINYNFNYVTFNNGALVEVEPEKTKWDIAWTYFVNSTPLSATESIPYGFQDFILQNKTGVQTAQVMNTSFTYDAITAKDAAGLTFSSAQNNIGSSWRAGGGPTSAPAVRTDRFYIIKDPAGQYFKLQFVSLTKSGERGWPQIKYALIK